MAETSIPFEQEVKPEPPVGSSAPPMRFVKTSSQSIGRPQVRGKFLFVGEEKFWIKGVSYGAFQPGPEGREYTDQDKLNRDFAQMARLGINTVRIPHTMPPRHLLDIAQRHGLRVIVGLSAEQYVGYLIDKGKKSVRDIKREILEKVRTCARHPALLCYALGNEIQAPLVRWLGCKRIERYLRVFTHISRQRESLTFRTLSRRFPSSTLNAFKPDATGSFSTASANNGL